MVSSDIERLLKKLPRFSSFTPTWWNRKVGAGRTPPNTRPLWLEGHRFSAVSYVAWTEHTLIEGDFMLGDYVNWGTVINFILAITALSGAGIAVWGLIVNRQKLDHDVLVLILNEITSPGASKDREEVRFAIRSGTKAIYIKEQIEKVFIGEDFDLGAAIERTIAHFDYIGFYLMGNTNKIEIETTKMALASSY
jgi:hypothetical protein